MSGDRSNLPLSRRGFLRGAAAAGGVFCGAGSFRAPASAAAARDPRFIVVILRGAVDGLSAIPPVGDPDYAGLHGDLAFSASGERAAPPLDGFFAAHPSLAAFKRMYDQKQAAVVHAVVTGYRDRSHFDGQDVLESGYPRPGRTDSGWLNRTIGALPEPAMSRERGLAVARRLRSSFAARRRRSARRRQAAFRRPTPTWPGACSTSTRTVIRRSPTERTPRSPWREWPPKAQAPGGEEAARRGPGRADARCAAEGASRLLAASDGPRIAALAFDGFDTHQNEGAAQGLLAQRLQGLDAAFDAFETDLGDAWRDTVVVAITEFGRTVRVNGTHGTDHGTGTVALLAAARSPAAG